MELEVDPVTTTHKPRICHEIATCHRLITQFCEEKNLTWLLKDRFLREGVTALEKKASCF